MSISRASLIRRVESPCRHSATEDDPPCARCLAARVRQRRYAAKVGQDVIRRQQRESYRRRYHTDAGFRERERARMRSGSQRAAAWARAAVRRALAQGGVAAIDYRTLEYLLSKTDGRCHICGRGILLDEKQPNPLSLAIDHRVPLASGGATDPENLWPAHHACNALKGDADLTPTIAQRCAALVDAEARSLKVVV